MVTNSFLIKTARSVMMKLGSGHTEAVYHCALVSMLMSSGVASMTEVNIPYFLNGICVGMGKADILTQTHLIELKANQKTPHSILQAQLQLSKYLRAMHLQGAAPRKAMLVLFNTPAEGPLYNRVSFVHVSHQKAMELSGCSLPPPSISKRRIRAKSRTCTQKKDNS